MSLLPSTGFYPVGIKQKVGSRSVQITAWDSKLKELLHKEIPLFQYRPNVMGKLNFTSANNHRGYAI